MLKRLNAFSLVEMLITLVVVSVLLSAFVPVITKKMTKDIEIRAISKDSNAPTTEHDYMTTNGLKVIPITDKFKSVKIKHLIAAGGGGGGGDYLPAGYKVGASEFFCNKYNSYYLPGSRNAGIPLCIQKYNTGTTNGSPTYTTQTATDRGSTAYNYTWTAGGSWATYKYSDDAICMSGISLLGDTWDTLCNHCYTDNCAYYAPTGTQKGDWRNPNSNDEATRWVTGLSEAEARQFFKDINYCGADATQFDYSCNITQSTFNASSSSYALQILPYVWEDETVYGFRFVASTAEDGTLTYSATDYSNYSVARLMVSHRCVTQGTALTDPIYIGGGGGSSSAYLKDITIPQEIIEASIDGSIRIFAGEGGKGGQSCSPALNATLCATGGKQGGESYVQVFDSLGNLKWGLRMRGALGGLPAALDEASALLTASGNPKYSLDVWDYTEQAWNLASIATSIISLNDSNSGYGERGGKGSGYLSGFSGGGKGAGSTSVITGNGGGYGGGATTADMGAGYDATSYGAGGGGASSGDSEIGFGGRGGNGYVELDIEKDEETE